MAVLELERRVPLLQRTEESIDTEPLLPLCRVMKQHGPAVGYLWSPCFEVGDNCPVRMETVHVQEIDGVVRESAPSIIKRHAQEGRETSESPRIPVFNVINNLIAMESRVLIAHPGVDCESFRFKPEMVNGLAQCLVRVTPVRTEFNDPVRFQCSHQPENEGYVASPAKGLRRTPIRQFENHRIKHRFDPE